MGSKPSALYDFIPFILICYIWKTNYNQYSPRTFIAQISFIFWDVLIVAFWMFLHKLLHISNIDYIEFCLLIISKILQYQTILLNSRTVFEFSISVNCPELFTPSPPPRNSSASVPPPFDAFRLVFSRGISHIS